MVFEELRVSQTISDEKFDAIYPESIRQLALAHFTPVEVAQIAAQFLVENAQTKVLDIGSGVGKFCFVGATCTEGQFTGVELRGNLHKIASQIAENHQLTNVAFIHANITQIDFSEYQAFYFYNSFFEYIETTERIDEIIELNKSLYKAYSLTVKEKLAVLPIGTRLVTFYSAYDEIPAGYKVLSKIEIQKITMWEKVA